MHLRFPGSATIPIALALALMSSLAGATDLMGTARVIDGDTIELAGTHVRFWGVDAVEHNQTCQGPSGEVYECGNDAKAALQALVKDWPVTCSSRDRDRYGRTVAVCRTESLELNATMVRYGWALDYTRYSGGRYRLEEAEARLAKRGIWSGRFEMPEAWRRRHHPHLGLSP